MNIDPSCTQTNPRAWEAQHNSLCSSTAAIVAIMSSILAPTALGPALVIGGCGFVGLHIVDALLKDPTCRPVSVISRNPNLNRCEAVAYYTGEIGNLDEI